MKFLMLIILVVGMYFINHKIDLLLKNHNIEQVAK